MNFKRYHVSRNLFDSEWEQGSIDPSGTDYPSGAVVRTKNYIPVTPNMIYSISRTIATSYINLRFYDGNKQYIDRGTSSTIRLIFGNTEANPMGVGIGFCCFEIIGTNIRYMRINDNSNNISTKYMMVEGQYTASTIPLYEPYSSEVWHDTPHYIHNTSTDTITTLPAVLYPTGTTATVGLKGNTLQSSTPSPTSPVMPQGTGDLETVGVKAGQYKIPISSANTTTPVYLGEVETTRRVKKLVLTGEESGWQLYQQSSPLWQYEVYQFWHDNIIDSIQYSSLYSTIAPFGSTSQSRQNYEYGCYTVSLGKGIAFQMAGAKDTFVNITAWKAYLAAQYAAGTPVTIWYVLATPETGIVNEPLRKIGDYADEVANVSIPVAAGGDTISVDTQVQPSEVSVNYKGWHPVQSVHEYDSNYTIATMQTLTIAQLQTHTISELQGGEWL